MNYAMFACLIVCFLFSSVSAQNETRIVLDTIDVSYINTFYESRSERLKISPSTNITTRSLKPQKLEKSKLQGVNKVLNSILTPKDRKKLRRATHVNLWGETFAILYDQNMIFQIEGDLTKSKIQASWKQLEETHYSVIVAQLNYLEKYLRINDWGYALMVHKLAECLYKKDKNAQKIFEAFILGESDFESRLSYNQDRIYLLLASEKKIYGARSSKLRTANGWKKFYVVDLGDTLPNVSEAINLGIRDIDYSYSGNKSDEFKFHQNTSPNFAQNTIEKYYTFKYGKKVYKLKATLNQNVVDFYQSVPFTGPYTHFKAPLSESATHSLVPQLKEIVKNQPKKEAVNMILRFVQMAFEYQTDSAQFGREMYLFPEQTLARKASDCEDRCFLFAYLVRNVIGLETIGLQYEGHMAVGVKLGTDLSETHFLYNDTRYYLCDPTVEGAKIGETLPKLQNKKAKFIISD